jgi:hypothetical protein
VVDTTLITTLQLADASLAAYVLQATVETDDVHCVISQVGDTQVIALRGTDPDHFIDLLLDAKAIFSRDDPILGSCSESFVADAEQLLWRLWPLLRDPFAITGHSKGASEAQALAAMLTHMGRPPICVTVFEPAQVGTLNDILLKLPGIATRHGGDFVTQEPSGRGHAQPLTLLPWVGPRPLNPIAYHAMAGVRAAVQTLLNDDE